MTLLVLFQSVFPIFSRDKKPGSSTSTSALLSLTVDLILEPTPTVFWVPKYTKNDLKRIFKAVLDARLLVARRNFNKL